MRGPIRPVADPIAVWLVRRPCGGHCAARVDRTTDSRARAATQRHLGGPRWQIARGAWGEWVALSFRANTHGSLTRAVCRVSRQVLTGCFVFMADLMRGLSADLAVRSHVCFTRASSYEGKATVSAGSVAFDWGALDAMAATLRGADVLVVEDIVDSGRTLHALVAALHERGAASVRIAALLDKKSRRVPDLKLPIDYVGFEVGSPPGRCARTRVARHHSAADPCPAPLHRPHRLRLPLPPPTSPYILSLPPSPPSPPSPPFPPLGCSALLPASGNGLGGTQSCVSLLNRACFPSLSLSLSLSLPLPSPSIFSPPFPSP